MLKEEYYKKYLALKISGYILCILPTIIAGIICLPMVVNKDAEQTLSATFIICLTITALPLYKWVRKQLKKESVAVFLWVFAILLFMIKSIPQQALNGLFVVVLVGAIGNTIGAVLLYFSDKTKEKMEFCGVQAVKTE